MNERVTRPLGNGHATHVDRNTIVATFASSVDMDGWKMTEADVDEFGMMLTIVWERIDPNASGFPGGGP